MTFIEEKIRITLGKLNEFIIWDSKTITGIKFAKCGYKTSNQPEEGLNWEDYEAGSPVKFRQDEHAWIKFTVDVPEVSDDECMILKATTGREGQWDSLNPQGMIFIGDSTTCAQALDTNHTEFLLTPGKKEIYIYFYAGMIGDPVLFLGFALQKKNMKLNRLYYDMLVPYEAMKCLDKNSYEYYTIINHLDKACQLLDLRTLRSKDLCDSADKAIEYLHEEFYGKVCGKEQTRGEIALFGHTHIDVAWLWTLAQTEEKAQRSFSTVIALMEQYPDYIFMSSQPQLYAYVKKNDPELYEKIKERIKEGRWETEGAMWLESDTNLVSGESLVRQIMYGKKFMKEEFGHDNHILWLPDVFGYSAALPQILKKCGVDTFFTAKLHWCETDKHPHDHFVWQGIDGSEIFAVISDTYVKNLNPARIIDTKNKHTDKKYSDVHLSTFGFGDGGGGPTKEMLEQYNRLKTGLPGFPKVTMSKAADTIDRIRENFDKTAEQVKFLPKWVGELYLEMHRGTYTSIAKNKKNNRKSEYALQKAETVSATAKLLTGANYPKETLDECWTTVLRNQFHDIIPGSSIKEVYEDSDKEYAMVLGAGKAMYDSAMGEISKNIATDGGILVYNDTPFVQSDVVTVGDTSIYAENIPAHGYAVVKPAMTREISAFATESTIENDNLKVVFDKDYHIVSLYDKKNAREVIVPGEKANVLEVFEDYPRDYDAWEITEYYKQKKWIADDVSSVEVINEPLYAGLRITRKYMNSVIKQDIILKKNAVRLDFVTEIDWHEDHVLLKAAFPFDVRANHANYEIQFGHVERPTHRNTSWDQAMFEVSAHKWADISDASYGVSLLNDCKYGYNTEENVMKLSLLKAATYPNPEADKEVHHFTYSVYPHAGSVTTAETVKQAYLLNKPMMASEIAANTNGKLSDSYSFACTDKASAVVDTAKLAEDGNGYIVRIYDSGNTKGNVNLLLGFKVSKAYSCDMLENIEEELSADGNTVSFTLSNFEVKTIRVIPE